MGQNQGKGDAESPAENIAFLDGGGGRGGPSDPNTNNFDFPLHLAACRGELERVKELLEADNSLTRWLDESGRTPLHVATAPTSSHNVAVIQLLLQRDKEDASSEGKPLLANVQDASKKTALHLAASSQACEVVFLLLEFGADPNLTDAQGSNPLHILAESNSESALECAKLILASPSFSPSAGSEPNSEKKSPVHVATQSKAARLLKLFVERGFDFASPDGVRGFSPLMVASAAAADGESEGNLDCVRILLDAYSPEQVNAKEEQHGRTALILAAYYEWFKILKLLVSSNKADPFTKDSQDFTVFHYAIWSNSLSSVKSLCECELMMSKEKFVEIIFDSHKPKNKEHLSASPVDIALHCRYTKIVEYLLAEHPNKEQWMEDDVLMDLIYSFHPTALLSRMNQCLKWHKYIPSARHDSVQMDFRIITGMKDPVEQSVPETEYLYQIKDEPTEVKKPILLHPLVQVFLEEKWTRIRALTWMHILVQLLWIFSYTLMVYEMYAPNCHHNKDANNHTEGEGKVGVGVGKEEGNGHMRILHSLGFLEWKEDCRFHQTSVQGAAVILYILAVPVLAKECFQLRTKSYWYFWNFVNLAQLGTLIVAVVNSAPAWQLSSASELAPWQTNLAAGGIFLAWVLMLREVDNIPKCGVYSAILKKVFWHCLQMLLFYSPLLIGFAMCLRILTPGKGQYNYLLFSLIKVVVMMTGELDFEDAFYGDDDNASGPSTAYNDILGQVVFLLLVLMTTIVLLNLLTGLAVADVKLLLEEAELYRLSRQLERIYMFESLVQTARRRMKWFDSANFLLYRWNVTGRRGPDKEYLHAAVQNVNIKDYSAELKARIREVLVTDEEL